MTRQDLIAIVCKVMGLVVIVLLIGQLPLLFLTLRHDTSYTESTLSSVLNDVRLTAAFAVGCAGGFILLVKSDAISRKVCGKSAEMRLEINLTRDELLRVSVIVLGIYFAATAFPPILIMAVRLTRSATTAGGYYFDFGVDVAKFIIGVLLIILARPRAALNLMHKLRTAGTPADDSPEDDHTQEK